MVKNLWRSTFGYITLPRVLAGVVFSPKSTRRQAEHQRRSLSGVGFCRRTAQSLARACNGHATALLALICSLAIAALWLPIDVTLPVFRETRNAEDFLPTLWQVQAGVVGLGGAVILFAFQSYIETRYPGSRQDFARETFLMPLLAAATMALLIPGLALLRLGHDAPGGWAATWATVMGAGSVLSVPAFFVMALRALDNQRIHRRRIQRLERAVESEVACDVIKRLSLRLIEAACGAAGLQFSPFGFGDKNSNQINSKTSGIVHDVKCSGIRALATYIQQTTNANATWSISVQDVVRPDTALVRVEPVPTRTMQWIVRHSVKIKKRTTDTTAAEALALLHQDALRTIREGNKLQYDVIRDAYVESLLAFPIAWRRYGQQFAGAVAEPLHPFQLTSLDHAVRNLYEQTRVALQTDQREILLSAAYLPVEVARKATELGAHALARRILSLMPSFVLLGRESGGGLGPLLAEMSAQYLNEYGNLILAFPLSHENFDQEQMDQLAQGLKEAAKAMIEVCRQLADSSNTSVLQETVRRWSGLFEHFDANTQLIEWRIELLQSEDQTAQETDERLAELHVALHQAELVADCQKFISGAFFSLLALVLDNIRSGRDVERSGNSAGVIAPAFGSASAIVEATNTSMRDDRNDLLTDWLLFRESTGEVHMLDTTGVVLRAMVALLLTRSANELTRLEESPSELIPDYATQIQAILDQEQDALGAQVLPVIDREERVQAIKTAIERCVERKTKQQKEAVRAADLDQQKVNDFHNEAEAGWKAMRHLPELYGAFDAYEEVEGSFDGPRCGLKKLLPKEWFTSVRAVVASHIGRDFGVAIAKCERDSYETRLVEFPESVDVSTTDAETFVDAVATAVANMRTNGYEPSAALVPLGLKTYQLFGGDSSGSSTVEQLPDSLRRVLHGAVEGVPILALLNPASERVWLIDVRRHSQWKQTLQDGEALSFDLKAYSASEVRVLIEENADLPWPKSAETAEQRTEWLEGQVLFDLKSVATSEILDRGAATSVSIPESLRDR